MAARIGALADSFLFPKTTQLQAEPAAQAASALDFPTQLVRGANNGGLLAPKNPRKNDRAACPAVHVETGKKMKKKRVVKIGQD